ncbi:MAG: calcium-binding EGF-like domain-containing protein [Deltaproteobacteria bacterium]|nr:calcium-binding EGF-like domain-containing protein [Deltaproteobacteria bacterium]
MRTTKTGLVTLVLLLQACGGGGKKMAGPPVDSVPDQPLPSAEVASGFVMATNAFGFPNFGGESDLAKIKPLALSRMFGMDKVCAAGDAVACKPTPIAEQYAQSVNRSMAGGRCEGFAILTGLMYLGKANPSEYGAMTARMLSLQDNAALGEEIAYWYSTQYLKDVVKASTKALLATDAVKFLAAEYAKPQHDLYRIGIVRLDEFGSRTGGHAILATGVAPTGVANQYVIKVYDNNHPDAERTIKVDTAANRWEYQASTDPNASSSLYFGDATNKNKMFLSAVSARLGTHPCPFCTGNTMQDEMALNQIFGFGSAELTVQDSSGRKSGEVRGQVISDIPNTVVTPGFSEELWEDRGPLTMVVPSVNDVSLQLTGTRGGQGTSSVFSFTPGGMVGIENASVVMGETELITISADGKTVTYSPSPGAAGTFLSAQETSTGEQVLVKIKVPEVKAMGTNTVITFDADTGNAKLTTQSMGDIVVGVEVARSNATGATAFVGTVRLPEMGSTTLLIQQWSNGGATLPAQVDANGDGVAEEMLALEDKRPKPPATCANTVLNCNAHGTCDDTLSTPVCKCSTGYEGVACAACAIGFQDNDANGTCSASCASNGLNACSGNGTCNDASGVAKCECQADYTGLACETRIDDCVANACVNGGTCVDGITAYSCVCPPGYTGDRCATNINECAPNPCQNGGTCTDGVNSFSCSCAPGYSGITCSTNNNECEPNPCQNGGTCIDGANSFTCSCAPGFDGVTCASNINECAPNPCQNGGTCADGINSFSCSCASGYSGTTCATNNNDCEPNPCQNGGACSDGVNSFTCSCGPGFAGVTCATNIDECASSPCQNGGTCTDGINSFSCSCAPGYSGANCATNNNECEPNPCQNGGICTDGVNSFTCSCEAGFAGLTCATNIDECAPNPCQNGGTCTDGVNAFTCACPPGFGGAQCQTVLACLATPYAKTPNSFFGTCNGCGTSASSWSTARSNAVSACSSSGCPGSCTVSTGAGDNCGFDGAINGYWCRSSCFLPTYVWEGTCAGCGTSASSWSTARDAAVAACSGGGCQGTCSVSSGAGNQCEFDARLNGYRCRSSCVCN